MSPAETLQLAYESKSVSFLAFIYSESYAEPRPDAFLVDNVYFVR